MLTSSLVFGECCSKRDTSRSRVKDEATEAIEEFGRIFKEEEERIRLIGEEVNERVMQVFRENEEDISCTLCLGDLPAIYPIGPWGEYVPG